MKTILQQAIHIPFKRSLLMLGLFTAISIACIVILVALPVVTTFKWLAILLVILSSVYFTLRDALLVLPWSWQTLNIDTKGQLAITNQRGKQFKPILAASTFVNSRLIILNFNREGIRFSLPPAILLKNRQDADAQRRLYIWLRWAKSNQIRPNAKLTATQNQDDFAASD